MKKILNILILSLLFNNCQQTKYESKEMQYSAMTKFEPNPEGKIKLFIYAGCPWCKKVIEFLQKIGKFDQIIIMNVANPDYMRELLKLTHGNTQCPYLCDEIKGIAMHESADIIKYFTTRF